ncbi:hypothetical protein SKAU_G00201600 [Synaphobranchus kaupii]|uniref:Uncharacterized protein n=1 Tax=Synaphobranchus kaupii TaxID=118154 RepID=A0A9Q1FFN6_SYNKA|nr:hypothetical protein SKAU_G00201600 [Synaphobranchus kaupii]
MNAVSIGEFHGLRVGSALVSIVAGCIIIGVSRDCDADAGTCGSTPCQRNPTMEQPVEALRREATQSQMNLERSKSKMGTLPDEPSEEEGPSSDVPDIIARRKPKQSSDIDAP